MGDGDMMLEAKDIGMAAALGSAASWAVGSVLFKQLSDHLSPIALTVAKGTAASVFLAAVLLVVGFEPIAADPLVMLILSGILGIAIGDTLFFMALQRLHAHAVVILFTLGQVLTVLLAVLLLGERPGMVEWIGMGLVVAGVTAVLWVQLTDEENKLSLVGIACGLSSVLAMSFSVIMCKDALESVGTVQATLVRMVAGTVSMTVVAYAIRRMKGALDPLSQPKVMVQYLGSVAVITFGGFWLSIVAIANADVAIANTLNSTEPLFVLPLAAFVLKEKITPPIIAASLVAVAGIALIAGAL